MSLAMFAAPIDYDNNESNNSGFINNRNTNNTNNSNLSNTNNYNSNNNYINQKKNQHNKTQKFNEINPAKVNAVLDSLHQNLNSNDNQLGDFNPISPPISAGVENSKLKEGFKQNNIEPKENDNVDLQFIKNNYLNDNAVEKYYKNLIPNYNNSSYPSISSENKPYYNLPSLNTFSENSNSENYKHLIEKLNYMINLLEENQDEKTNNVTEEVVLYSFLGIFIIFIVEDYYKT